MLFTCVNGQMIPAGQPAIQPSNRSYRYGEGVFETMKQVNGQVPLLHYHMDRLFAALETLKFTIPATFNRDTLSRSIKDIYDVNGHHPIARIRLSVSRNNSTAIQQDDGIQFIIEYFPLDPSTNALNAEGLTIGLYTDARKSIDKFSHLKSANFLPYALAMTHAKENKLDDCLILNQHGNPIEASIANLWLIIGNDVITPPLSEGCIEGVMRRYLLEHFREPGHPFILKEEQVTLELIKKANEIFLSNAVSGIKWVKRFEDTSYQNKLTAEIYKYLVKDIW